MNLALPRHDASSLLSRGLRALCPWHCLVVAWHVGLALPRDMGVALPCPGTWDWHWSGMWGWHCHARDVGLALLRDVGVALPCPGTCGWGPQSQSCCAVRPAPLGIGQDGGQPLCMSPAPPPSPGLPAGQAWHQGTAVMGMRPPCPLWGVGAGALRAQVLLRGVDP